MMNTIILILSIGALAAAAVLIARAYAGRAGQRVSGTAAAYRTRDGRIVRYTVAPEAKLLDVGVTVVGSRTVIHLTTGAPISPSGGPLAIDVHFSDDREIAFVRNYTYPSLDRFERAAVLDVRTGAVLGKVDVAVDGSRLELACASALVTGRLRIAVSRYLPSREALGEAVGGLESAYAAMHTPSSPGTMHAAVPFAGPRRVANPGIHFGPPPDTTNFNPTTPVVQLPSGNGKIDVVDHDSNWPKDGDYDTGFVDACGNPILCGWFTWTEEEGFLGGCGPDLDGDGRLDGNEVQWYFGFCPFESAVNDTWQDASGHVHWKTMGRRDDQGKMYEYIIDPTTGHVGVWYTKNHGETWDVVYEGPGRGGPGGWRFFPAPPPTPPACSTASRRGDAARPARRARRAGGAD